VRRLDVTSDAEVAAAAEEVGAVDVLFNCAGYVAHGSLLECDERDWDFSFDLNVKSMFRTIRAWLPGMLEAGGGSIVNIASVASSGPYRATKASSARFSVVVRSSTSSTLLTTLRSTREGSHESAVT